MNRTPLSKPDIYNFVGKILGQFELEEFVDEGGMGIVYKAIDLKNRKTVAVKILPPRYLIHQERRQIYLKLFHREGEILKKLRHPNIVSVYETGIQENIVYIAMEWLEGCSLGRALLEEGPFSVDKTSHVLQQICSALDLAHQNKVIHLDIKANNIFLVDRGTPEEKVKVIDFGLARIIQSTLGSTISRVVGTPQYMAPEVFENKASTASDIYSIGVLTFEMLTGVLPFSQTHIYALVRQQMNERPPSIRAKNKEVTEYIDKLINRTLDKNPLDRPRTPIQFYQEFVRGSQVFDSRPIERTFPLKPIIYLDDPSFYRNPISLVTIFLYCLIAIPYICLGIYLYASPEFYYSDWLIFGFSILSVVCLFYLYVTEAIKSNDFHPFVWFLIIPSLIFPFVFLIVVLSVSALVALLIYILLLLISNIFGAIKRKRIDG